MSPTAAIDTGSLLLMSAADDKVTQLAAAVEAAEAQVRAQADQIASLQGQLAQAQSETLRPESEAALDATLQRVQSWAALFHPAAPATPAPPPSGTPSPSPDSSATTAPATPPTG